MKSHPKLQCQKKTEAVSNVKILKCDECCFTSTKKSTIKKHKSNHNTCLQCDICGQNFDCKDAIKLHKDTKHIKNRLKKNSIVFGESMDKHSILKKFEKVITMGIFKLYSPGQWVP